MHVPSNHQSLHDFNTILGPLEAQLEGAPLHVFKLFLGAYMKK